jgi:hypothetical protein
MKVLKGIDVFIITILKNFINWPYYNLICNMFDFNMFDFNLFEL